MQQQRGVCHTHVSVIYLSRLLNVHTRLCACVDAYNLVLKKLLIDTVHLHEVCVCAWLDNVCQLEYVPGCGSVCVCMGMHMRVHGGNHYFNIALIKLPIYRSESTQEPFLGRLPRAADWCQAL